MTRPPIQSVLVVDDDNITLKALRILLEHKGWAVMTASSAEAAQQLIEKHTTGAFSCVLTDYRMPGMNGLELVKWLQAEDANLSVIILTVLTDRMLIADALRSGVCDFLDKPFNNARLCAAVEKAFELTAEGRSLNSAATQVEAIAALDMQLINSAKHKLAQSAQQTKGKLPTPKLTVRNFPTQEMGGDFVSFKQINPHELMLVIGDISGHDLRAGFVSAYFQGLTRGMLETSADGQSMSETFNTHLIEDWNSPKKPNKQPLEAAAAPKQSASPLLSVSLACSLANFNFKKNKLTLNHHGLPLPILSTVHKGQNCLSTIGTGNPALGWFKELEDEKTSVNIGPVGTCTFFSDGLEDYATYKGVSTLSLATYLAKQPEPTSAGLSENLANYLEEKADDLLVAQITWGMEHKTNSEASEAMQPIFFAEYKGDSVDAINTHEAQWQESMRLLFPETNPMFWGSFSLCLREAVLNAIKHGCNYSAEKMCSLSIHQKSNQLHVWVEDPGPGYNIKALSHEPDLGQAGHISFGLTIVRAYTAHMAVHKSGAALEMVFELPEAE